MTPAFEFVRILIIIMKGARLIKREKKLKKKKITIFAQESH